MPNNKKIIQQTIAFVKNKLKDAEGGHDWWHIERVLKIARKIAKSEKVDYFIVELGALLHDIADAKFYDGDDTVGPKITKDFLQSIGVDKNIVGHVVKIVKNISFKGGRYKQRFSSAELDVVQDADRLDALGAMGIARTFYYNGFKQREIYNPNIKPNLNMTKTQYYSSQAPAINHFYEKLLLLKERMNTATGKKMALHRHAFMEKYLDEFYREWDGEV